jgi:KTSC domain
MPEEMQRTAVDSTTMRSVGYDAAEQVLEIEFTSGAVYQYVDVPAAIFDRLMQAESKGRYFNDEIRDDYITLREPARRRTRRAGG